MSRSAVRIRYLAPAKNHDVIIVVFFVFKHGRSVRESASSCVGHEVSSRRLFISGTDISPQIAFRNRKTGRDERALISPTAAAFTCSPTCSPLGSVHVFPDLFLFREDKPTLEQTNSRAPKSTHEETVRKNRFPPHENAGDTKSAPSSLSGARQCPTPALDLLKCRAWRRCTESGVAERPAKRSVARLGSCLGHTTCPVRTVVACPVRTVVACPVRNVVAGPVRTVVAGPSAT